jgi:hypothetical protein
MLALQDASTRRTPPEILPSVRLLAVLHPEYSQSWARRSYVPFPFPLSSSSGARETAVFRVEGVGQKSEFRYRI